MGFCSTAIRIAKQKAAGRHVQDKRGIFAKRTVTHKHCVPRAAKARALAEFQARLKEKMANGAPASVMVTLVKKDLGASASVMATLKKNAKLSGA